eukprot:TRINITY_DN73946_c0_g1_i1.p1 TRINITY_DN73946_c0_g1~~TRINITY_DN73946_c0_g1_i1.p1  ORF type:complete len:307 (-),score=70.46 TRINITY_DN73946_c0_g1_i1:313-1233(-)
MTMMQDADAWGSGEVVSIGMLYGQAQLLEAKRQAELQESVLGGEEQDAIQQGRADAVERERPRSRDAERRGTAGAALHAKFEQRKTVADSAQEKSADDVRQSSVEQPKPRSGGLRKKTSKQEHRTEADCELLAKQSERQAAAEHDDESDAVAANCPAVKIASAGHEASEQAMTKVPLPALLIGAALPVGKAMDHCIGQHRMPAMQPAFMTPRTPPTSWWPETVAARDVQRFYSEPGADSKFKVATSVATQNSADDETHRQVRFRTRISEYDVTTPYAVVYGEDHHPRNFDFDCSGEMISKPNRFCM